MKVTMFFLLALCLLTACAHQPQKNESSHVSSVSYTCITGEKLEVRFFPLQGVAVLVRNNRTMELQQQPSGSGFIYSNGRHTIRGKGNELLLEIGRMVPIRCVAQ